MVRLHLVGFTTDLKNLIFADERGAKAGGFVVSVDSRLKNTLREVERLEEEAESQYDAEAESVEEVDRQPAAEAEPEPTPPTRPKAPKVVSKLTPKEIQSLLRQGKTEEQVARLAGTKVDWIKRFSFAILAERQDVIDAVKAATLSKPRLGPSAVNVGEAVEENIGAKRLRMTPQEMDDAWKAVRKNGRWHVSFEYQSRGQKRLARYSFDPANRMVEPLNEIALELGWRPATGKKTSSPSAAPSPRVSGSIVKPTAARSSPASVRTGATPRGGTRQPVAPRSTGRSPAGGSEPAPGRRARPTATTSRPAPGSRTPLPRSEPEEPPRAPRRPASRIEPEAEDLADNRTTLPEPEPQGPAGFVPGKPKPDRPDYSSIPKVWRPSRRP